MLQKYSSCCMNFLVTCLWQNCLALGIGEYTPKSPYLIWFMGSFSRMRISPIWRAKAEPKARFFAWTLLHNKILTVDNRRKGWRHNSSCPLCSLGTETILSHNKNGGYYLVGWTWMPSGTESERHNLQMLPKMDVTLKNHNVASLMVF